MSDFVTEARAVFGTQPFTALQALALLPIDAMPAQTQWLIKNGSMPAKSLGQHMARMNGVEKVTARTKVGVFWRVKP